MRETVKEMASKGYSLDRMVSERIKAITDEAHTIGVYRDDSVRWRTFWRQKFREEARKFSAKSKG